MSEQYEQIKEKAYSVGLIARSLPGNWGVKEYGYRYYLTGRGYKMQHSYPLEIWGALYSLKKDNIDFFVNLKELSHQVNREFERRKFMYLTGPAPSTGKNQTLFRKKQKRVTTRLRALA